MDRPNLKFLHTESVLIELKLEYFRRISTELLIDSLKPEKPASLKTTHDGTIMDGNHRVKILKERNVNVDDLPREIWERIE